MMKFRKSHLIVNAVLLLVSAIMIYPILFILNISLKTKEEFIKFPLELARSLNFDNFLSAWSQGRMELLFKNSIIFTVFIVAGTIIITAIASFPISRGHVRFSRFLYFLFLSGIFLPVSYIPLIYLMKFLGLINTYPGYIILMINMQVPISTFIFCGFVKKIPRELDDAAAIDGCPYIRYILTVIIPIMKPAIMTVTMLVSVIAWNEFINPLIFIVDKGKRPLTSGLYSFLGQFYNDWTVLAAGVIIVALPLIVLYIFIQRYLLSGMTSGSVKG